MTEERKKVLEMVAAGIVTPDEAEQLLEKLESASATEPKRQRVIGWRIPARMQYLRIAIDHPGQDQVNVKLPLSFLRAGVKLASVLPASVAERLRESGIHIEELNKLDGEAMEEALQQLNVNISKGDKKVQVFCE